MWEPLNSVNDKKKYDKADRDRRSFWPVFRGQSTLPPDTRKFHKYDQHQIDAVYASVEFHPWWILGTFLSADFEGIAKLTSETGWLLENDKYQIDAEGVKADESAGKSMSQSSAFIINSCILCKCRMSYLLNFQHILRVKFWGATEGTVPFVAHFGWF